MTSSSARERFSQARVARLGTVNSVGAPHLVPVTFALISGPQDLVVFAIDHKPKSTTSLRRLDNIAGNPSVSFLADNYDEDWERLWWARVDATAAVLDGELRQRALAALIAKYVQYQLNPPDSVAVGAAVSRWTGWQASPLA